MSGRIIGSTDIMLLVLMTSWIICVLVMVHVLPARAIVECDFNDGVLCEGWSQGDDDVIDEFDWSVGFSKGHLEESNNTTNVTISDYFLYMATTDQKPSDRAVFATPVMTSPLGQVNITFLYCMFGDHTQSLSVFIKDMSLGSFESEIWSRDGKDANEWTAVHKYANVTGPFRVIFQGKMGKGSAAIAMDDIFIQNADMLTDDIIMRTKNMTTPENTDTTTSSTTTTTASTTNEQLYEVTSYGSFTTTITVIDFETLPLIIAAAGGVIFWLGILCVITYFTCRKSKRAKQRVKRANNTLTKKMAKSRANDIEVNYAPRRTEEIKIYRVPDAPLVTKEHIYNNQIPCLYNYDPLSIDRDSGFYTPCSSTHDYDTIN